MKYRTTKKAVKNGYSRIISISYCGLQNLLAHLSPVAYTCGRDGWYSDIYEVAPGTVIVTGYQPFGTSQDYDLVHAYDVKAEKIMRNWSIPYEDRLKKCEGLLQDFLAACK